LKICVPNSIRTDKERRPPYRTQNKHVTVPPTYIFVACTTHINANMRFSTTHINVLATTDKNVGALSRLYCYDPAMTKAQKVKWKNILRRWWGLSANEKLVALSILAHSNREGFATVSHGDISDTSGGLDVRTVRKATERLSSVGSLEIQSHGKGKKFTYRLHTSTKVLQPKS